MSDLVEFKIVKVCTIKGYEPWDEYSEITSVVGPDEWETCSTEDFRELKNEINIFNANNKDYSLRVIQRTTIAEIAPLLRESVLAYNKKVQAAKEANKKKQEEREKINREKALEKKRKQLEKLQKELGIT